MITIETSILKSLLYDKQYVEQVYPHLEESYFDGAHQTLFSVYKDIYDQYNEIPTLEAIAIKIQQYSVEETEHLLVLDIVKEILEGKDELPKTEWLVKETEEYCVDKSFTASLFRSLEIAEGNDKTYDRMAIPDLIQTALSVSFDQSVGMDFFDGAEERHDLYSEEDTRLKFPIHSLNVLSTGGHKRKCLSAAIAGVNVGKSALMCFLAGEFMKMGKNVVYISMEMAAEEISLRVEANLLDKTTDQIEAMSRDSYLSKIDEIRKKTTGKLIVKQYPTGAGHAGHFRALLNEIKNKKKVEPDIVFVDYINICSSFKYNNASGMNSYSLVKSVAEELRAIAVDYDIHVMTATQFTREGMTSSDPDMTKTSESIGLPQTLDFYFAVISDDVLQANNKVMFKLLKSRWGNRFKAKPQLCGADYDRMRFYDVAGGVDEPELPPTKPSKISGKPKRNVSLDFD